MSVRPGRLRGLALAGGALLASAPAVGGCGSAAAPTAGPAAGGPPPRLEDLVPVPRFIVYDTERAARAVFRPRGGLPPLSPEDGAYRQEPSRGGVFMAGGGDVYRLAKVAARDLAGRPPAEIARRLRHAVVRGCGGFRCRSHMVAVDDVGEEFRGRSGAALARAMRLLDRPSPFGGSYAQRVHLYVADEVLQDLARPTAGVPRGFGPVVPALALAGGVWLEMYDSDAPGREGPVPASLWHTGPPAMLAALSAAGGSPARVRFVFGGATALPAGPLPPACWTPLRCAFALARVTPQNREVLSRGAAEYRLGHRDALAWLAEVDRLVLGIRL